MGQVHPCSSGSSSQCNLVGITRASSEARALKLTASSANLGQSAAVWRQLGSQPVNQPPSRPHPPTLAGPFPLLILLSLSSSSSDTSSWQPAPFQSQGRLGVITGGASLPSSSTPSNPLHWWDCPIWDLTMMMMMGALPGFGMNGGYPLTSLLCSLKFDRRGRGRCARVTVLNRDVGGECCKSRRVALHCPDANNAQTHVADFHANKSAMRCN